MRQSEVDNLVAIAHAKGRSDIDDLACCCFLGAKEILRDSRSVQYHEHATKVVNEFLHWMETGQRWTSWERFLIPVEYVLTEEERLRGE